MDSLLGFTGDLFLGSGAIDPSFAAVAKALGPQVSLVVNFEGTLFDDADRLTPTRKKILLTSPLSALSALRQLPVRLFTIGHNHIGDYGNRVGELTVDSLRQIAPTIGAGYSGTDFHIGSATVGDVAVGFATYCTSETSPLFTTPARLGPCELTSQQIEKDILKLRRTNRLLVALVHWGDQCHHYPTAEQLKFGPQLIDAGFDLVIGTHPHSVQGYARHRGRYIFYSLGNFSFHDYRAQIAGLSHDLRWMRRCRWGIVPVFRVLADRFELDGIRFVSVEDGRLQIAGSRALEWRLRRFSMAVSGRKAARVCAFIRTLERPLIRYGEFSVRDRKMAVVAKKIARLIGIDRALGKHVA
jgi:poly-gamma-glutamate capsule biosynthesis protein CapA/YwtB (metallophosphatase superfamily)